MATPNTIPIHNVPLAQLAADEAPIVYHYNDAGTHPNGEVLSGELVNGRAEYGISLSEEPSGGVTAFFMIHADTSQTEQELGFDLTLPEDCYMRMRVRQYTGTGDEYDEAVSWSTVDESGAQQILVPMDKAATAAGGKTILELEFNRIGSGTFPAYEEPAVLIKNYYTKITHYEPYTRIAYVCDEKDNYRFGFNTQEKVNEVAGIGNHYTALYWEYDSRLGRRWNLDPVDQVNISNYAVNRNNPIEIKDPNGDCPTCIVGLVTGGIKAGFDFVGQVSSNLSKGQSFSKAVKEVDYGDVAISFGQGFVDGATLGATAAVSKHVATGLKSAIDWKPATETPDGQFKMLGGGFLFGEKYDKSWQRTSADFVTGEIGVFVGDKAGKMFSNSLGSVSPAASGRYYDYLLGKETIKNLFTIPTKIGLTHAKDIGFREYYKWKYPNSGVYIEPLQINKIVIPDAPAASGE